MTQKSLPITPPFIHCWPKTPPMKKWIRQLFIIVLLIPYTTLAENKVVQFTFFNDFKPLSYGTGNQVQGHLIDIISEVFRHIDGYTPTFYGDTWKRSQQLVRNGEADGFFTVAVDARKEYMWFADEIGLYLANALFYAKNNPKINAIQQIQSKDDF